MKYGPAYLLVALVTITVFADKAMADQIDGNWCSPTGKTISVAGSQITTPGGKSITGRYDRHHVDFQIPEGEMNAGKQFSADQLNDEEIRVTITMKSKTTAFEPVIWRRCELVS